MKLEDNSISSLSGEGLFPPSLKVIFLNYFLLEFNFFHIYASRVLKFIIILGTAIVDFKNSRAGFS